MSRIVGARAAGFATIAGDPLTLRLARSQAVQAPTNEPPLHMIHTMRTAILAALPLAFRLFYRTGLREHMADKERQEILVKASGSTGPWCSRSASPTPRRPGDGPWTPPAGSGASR